MKRLLLAAFVLVATAYAAMAAPSVLPAGSPLSNTCYGTSVTAPFTTLPAAPQGVFDVQANFKPSGSIPTAVGTITLTRSTDGGVTFAPITAGAQNLSALSATGGLLVDQSDTSQQFRLECSITSGQIGWTVETGGVGNGYAFTAAASNACKVDVQTSFYNAIIGMPVSGYEVFKNYASPLSAAQVEALYEAKWTPLTSSFLSGLTTVYRVAQFTTTNPDGSHTTSAAYVTLSLDSSAGRAAWAFAQLGMHREVRVQSATVTAIVDGNGNAVTAAQSGIVNPTTGNPLATYTVGATIALDDATPIKDCSTSHAFADPLNYAGMRTWPTLREAVDWTDYHKANTDGPSPGLYPPILPNPTALGL